MQKIKKPISILLSVLMVLSVFAVVPFTASAATYDSDNVNLSELQVGDIITADVSTVGIGGCTVVLKGGRYGDGDADRGRLYTVYPDDRESSSINIRSTNGNFDIMDMNGFGFFVPVDQNGEFANKLIVLAKEGDKITIGGYSEADTPEPLNSSVKYRYYNGEYFRNGNTPAANTYKVVSGNKKWTDGNWYVVTEDVTISERITTSGTVNLVLCDGAKLTAKKGISVNGDNWYDPNQNATLNIYSQSGGTGTLFAGTIDGTSTTMPRNPENAAIGGNDDFPNGSITIHGGNITAIANAGAAGIGGGRDNPCSTVTVYGGNVTAGCTGGYGSGIGGGYDVEGGSVNVAGGHVIAYGLGGEDAAAIGNMAENINLTVADGSEIKAGSSASDAAVVASSNDALKKVYVEINAPALPQAYDITWKMDNGSVLKTKEFAAGTTPTYDGATPTKEDDDNSYTFTGWTPAVEAVTADATYTATFDATPYVASVTSNGTTTKYTDFGTAVSNWTDGSTLTLLANVTTSSVILFESGVKTLDLNGYGIKNTSANYNSSNSVIFIRGSGTQLTLQDSRPNETTHYFTAPAGNAGLATDISDIDSGDQQSFHGGYLTGGNCFSGGGIRVDNGANLIMTGGTIIGNRGQYGGGIDVEKSGSAGGSATISGGAIMYNYGTNYNGAIHTNTANYVSVSNCKITNNYAEHGAGGAYKSSINGGFSGNLIIKDNKTGNTECNLLIESNQYISLTSALGENASIGITMNNPGVFTNSSTTDYNVASKFKSDNVNYKVVKNAAGQLELGPKLFVGNTITLNGDIGVNFFINSAYANFNGAQTATVVFTWDDGNCTKEVNLKELTKESNGCYKATCDVVAAHMAHKIHAVVYLNGAALDETNDFSVQDYAEELFNHPEKYDTKGKPVELKALAKALLNYGAMAQTMFDKALKEKPDLANKNVGATDLEGITAEQVTAAIKVANNQNTGADMTEVAAALHANWYTTTVIYLSKNTVKHYFTKADDSFNASAYKGTQSNYYYFVQKENIAAADLDTLQEFKVGDYTFKYSALDYVVAVINSNMADNAKNIAKALFLYNQAANAYFD